MSDQVPLYEGGMATYINRFVETEGHLAEQENEGLIWDGPATPPEILEQYGPAKNIANTAMMFPLIFLLLAITAYIPVSPRPEQAFLRLLGRYFRSSEYLMSSMRWDPAHTATRLERWKKAFHEREIATLPA